jgi:hypothetical protein
MALMGRMEGDADKLAASRLPVLEAALNADLLPQRQQVLAKAVIGGVQSLLEHATRRLRDQRRHNAEQMLELRGLRGKSKARVAQMLERVHADTEEFERCTARLAALRAVHTRMMRDVLKSLSADRIRAGVAELQATLGASWFNLRARAAFGKLCQDLILQMDKAAHQCTETGQMLQASFQQLNADFGFSLGLSPSPDLATFREELQLIERGYSRYFGVARVVRKNERGINEQLERMLVSKLRTVFETASGEIDAWNHAASSQIDGQYRERRKSFKRRSESLERILEATDDLERRLVEVETQDAKLLEQIDRAFQLGVAVRERAERGPSTEPVLERPDIPLIRSDGLMHVPNYG